MGFLLTLSIDPVLSAGTPVSSSTPIALNEAWPTEGGSYARTRTTSNTPPVRPIETLWSTSISGAWIEPAVADGIVYVAQSGGELTALDLSSGVVNWTFKGSPDMAPDGDNVYPPPLDTPMTVADGAIFIGTAELSQGGMMPTGFNMTNSFLAIDQATGKLRCRFETDAAFISAPVVRDGVVYVGAANGRLFALDAATCQERWSTLLSEKFYILSSPALAGDRLVITGNSTSWLVSGSSRAFALDLRTGVVVWSYAGPNYELFGTPVVDGGRVYLSSSTYSIVSKSSGAVHALDLATGDEVWSRELDAPQGALAAWRDTVFSVDDEWSDHHELVALAAKTGAERWRVVLPAASSNPVVIDSTVFLTGDGVLRTFDAASGQPLWSDRFSDYEGANRPILLVANARLVVLAGQTLVVLGPASEARTSEGLAFVSWPAVGAIVLSGAALALGVLFIRRHRVASRAGWSARQPMDRSAIPFLDWRRSCSLD